MNENNPTAKPVISDPSKIAKITTAPAPHTVEPVKMPDSAQPKVAVTGEPKDAPKTNS